MARQQGEGAAEEKEEEVVLLWLRKLPPAGETARRMGVRLERRGPPRSPHPSPLHNEGLIPGREMPPRAPHAARRLHSLSAAPPLLLALVLIEMQARCPRTASPVTDDN